MKLGDSDLCVAVYCNIIYLYTTSSLDYTQTRLPVANKTQSARAAAITIGDIDVWRAGLQILHVTRSLLRRNISSWKETRRMGDDASHFLISYTNRHITYQHILELLSVMFFFK